VLRGRSWKRSPREPGSSPWPAGISAKRHRYAAICGVSGRRWLTKRVTIEIDDPTGPNVDRWLRQQEPGTELALRYSIRGRFRKAEASPALNARVDELFALLKPGEDDLAAIMRYARELGAAITKQLGDAGGRHYLRGDR
jgi:hypothetical protein